MLKLLCLVGHTVWVIRGVYFSELHPPPLGGKRKMVFDELGGKNNEKWDIKKQVFSFFLILFTQKNIYFPHSANKP